MADCGRYGFYQTLLSLGGFGASRLKAQSCKIRGGLRLTSLSWTLMEMGQLVLMGFGPGFSAGCSEGAEGAQCLLRCGSRCGKRSGICLGLQRLLLFHSGCVHLFGFSLFHKWNKKAIPALFYGALGLAHLCMCFSSK